MDVQTESGLQLDRAAPREGAPSGVSISFGGEAFVLLASRAAYWTEARTLLVADLHLGKGEALRAGGAPMPGSVLRGDVQEQLNRLEDAINRCGARRVMVLGDLLHAPEGLDEAMVAQVERRFVAWRTVGVCVCIVPGNHDRKLDRVSGRWCVQTLAPEYHERGLTFQHAPPTKAQRPTWCGHVHPVVRIRGGGDSLKLPCFAFQGGRSQGGAGVAILPAFTGFSSGAALDPRTLDAAYAIAGERVLLIAPHARG
ncbi:MAG: ligase-associated DNA damage response endonuclease PdeM [Planctomycetota bacterium]|nr:ligase-associated DNA damage response endonuclease PdeM [Planctomycetota bacterium]